MGPTGWIVLGVNAALVIIIILWIISAQRSLAAMDENVNNAMSQIGVQLSSRWDALTALLDLTKGCAEYEDKTVSILLNLYNHLLFFYYDKPIFYGKGEIYAKTRLKYADEYSE